MTTTDADPRRWTRPERRENPRPIVLLLPGQGSQHRAMATGLYGHEPVFTDAVDEVLGLMGAEGSRIRADWLGADPVVGIDDVRRAQPLLFAIDHALGRLIRSWGVDQAALLGHSAGEVVAATLAGVLTLPDAVRAQMGRVREACDLPAGGMLAVAADEDELRPYLTGDVAIAAVNSARQTMLAGTVGPLSAVGHRLRAAGYVTSVVPATSPFHSPAMDPAVRSTAAELAGLRLRAPAEVVYSGYTTGVLRAEEATDPWFWAGQLAGTVRFGPALERLLADHDDRVLLVEAGPGQTLSLFARRQRAVRSGGSVVLPMLPVPRAAGPEPDRRHVLGVAARLWAEGHELDLDRVAACAPAAHRAAVPAVAG